MYNPGEIAGFDGLSVKKILAEKAGEVVEPEHPVSAILDEVKSKKEEVASPKPKKRGRPKKLRDLPQIKVRK
jgi:hypothetical protein